MATKLIKKLAGKIQRSKVKKASGVPPRLNAIKMIVCVEDAPGSNWQKALNSMSSSLVTSLQKNFPIAGIEAAQQIPDSLVFQAGTGFQGDTIVTKGGRVLTVTSKGADLQDAVQKAQKALSHIQFEGMYFRKDIGYEFA